MQETNIVNVYKLPPSKLVPTSLPDVLAPTVYAGVTLIANMETGSTVVPILMVTPQWNGSLPLTQHSCTTLWSQALSYSAHRKSTSNPDLTFAKCRSDEVLPVRHILDRFPQSHHQPSLITISSLVHPLLKKDITGQVSSNTWKKLLLVFCSQVQPT